MASLIEKTSFDMIGGDKKNSDSPGSGTNVRDALPAEEHDNVSTQPSPMTPSNRKMELYMAARDKAVQSTRKAQESAAKKKESRAVALEKDRGIEICDQRLGEQFSKTQYLIEDHSNRIEEHSKLIEEHAQLVKEHAQLVKEHAQLVKENGERIDKVIDKASVAVAEGGNATNNLVTMAMVEDGKQAEADEKEKQMDIARAFRYKRMAEAGDKVSFQRSKSDVSGEDNKSVTRRLSDKEDLSNDVDVAKGAVEEVANDDAKVADESDFETLMSNNSATDMKSYLSKQPSFENLCAGLSQEQALAFADKCNKLYFIKALNSKTSLTANQLMVLLAKCGGSVNKKAKRPQLVAELKKLLG